VLAFHSHLVRRDPHQRIEPENRDRYLREKLRAWRKKRADEVLKSDAEAQGK